MNSFKNFSINKKRNSLFKFLIAGFIILFLLIILNIFVYPIKNYFYTLSAPIQKSLWSAGESSSIFLGSFLKSGVLKEENEFLKNENQRLLSEVAFLKSIEQGNKAQSDVSASCQNSGFNLKMVGVVGLDENDILSINKGSNEGIKVGMPVINQQNVLYGKVLKVYKNFSQIMLISNKNSIVNVKVQKIQDNIEILSEESTNESSEKEQIEEINGVIKGIGKLNAYLDLIPIDKEINPQDILITSALDKSFPKDLLVAKIVQKEKNDQKPFQQAQLNLFLDIKKTDNLFVITNYKQK